MDYRIWKIAATLSATTLNFSGDSNVSGSPAWPYRGVWGIMVATSTTGFVSMSGGGGINLANLAVGVPIPCWPTYVSASAGTVYLLA